MIRTISDEASAASYVTNSLEPLPLPDGPAASVGLMTPAVGSSSGLTVTAAPGSISTLLTQQETVPGSVWPVQIDSFPEFSNNTGTVAQTQDFNMLVAALLALETWTLRVARGSVGDLAQRINPSGARTL